MKTLLIVESGPKCESIQKYAGPGYDVRASSGHVRDMPKEFGVDLQRFEETYVFRDPRKKKLIAEWKRQLQGGRYDRVIFGTDKDREGEAIAWHIAECLGVDPARAERVVWTEITRKAVDQGLANPSLLDMSKVGAARARRLIDRVLGYGVSGNVTQKAGFPSAGRVQSPVLHMICAREDEIEAFVPETYYLVRANYAAGFVGTVSVQTEGKEGEEDWVQWRCESESEAEAVRLTLESNPHSVEEVEERKTRTKPPRPYDTADFLSDAPKKLEIPVSRAVDIAQELFEREWITYPRTDSHRVSEDGIQMAREWIQSNQPDLLPKKAPKFRGGDQDGHECIRPTSLTRDRRSLKGDHQRLYTMITARFLASMSKPAEYLRTTIRTSCVDHTLFAEGSVLTFDGFLRFWGPYSKSNESDLPRVTKDESLPVDSCESDRKKTSPPKRWDQGAIVTEMKRLGVGRPSTYRGMVEVLLSRGYVDQRREGKRKSEVLFPTSDGRTVDQLLRRAFPDMISPEYTRAMEEALDGIESGDLERTEYLKSWYSQFAEQLKRAEETAVEFSAEHGLTPRNFGSGNRTDKVCDRCQSAHYVKIPKKPKGAFYACEDNNCGFTRDIRAKTKPEACPKCQSTLVARRNRKDNEKFFACAGKGCKHTESIDGQTGWQKEDTDKPCPRCGNKKLILLTRRKEEEDGFFACPDKEGCQFTVPHDTAVHPSPCDTDGCGGRMLRYRSKKKHYYYRCPKCDAVRFRR